MGHASSKKLGGPSGARPAPIIVAPDGNHSRTPSPDPVDTGFIHDDSREPSFRSAVSRTPRSRASSSARALPPGAFYPVFADDDVESASPGRSLPRTPSLPRLPSNPRRRMTPQDMADIERLGSVRAYDDILDDVFGQKKRW